MKIFLKNLGPLKQAEFTLGDLTIICGRNNTGKTYAAYALFGFLHAWREVLTVEVDSSQVEALLVDGVIRLDVQEYAKHLDDIVAKACQAYTKQLFRVFAAPNARFRDSKFNVQLPSQGNAYLVNGYERRISAAKTELFLISKEPKSPELMVTLLAEKEKVKIPVSILSEIIGDALKDVLFAYRIPRPFIASAERTGAAIFRRELNFARNRLLEEMSQADKTINPMELLFKNYQDYALPVKENVNFTRQLESIVKNTSFLAEEHPNLLQEFSDIIGGKYEVTRNDELYYVPTGKKVKLSMDESSSAVRSLLDIGFYLRHEAKRGDLLIVDEPELNLHPENQRRMARLFARLVNIGIKIFVTTHSDYLVKELNTLLMLNHDKSYLKEIMRNEGYCPEELLSSDKVRVYIAEVAPIVLEGGQRKTQCQTLVPADIDPELGIEVRSFDTTIETMSRIQEAIVWGQDE